MALMAMGVAVALSACGNVMSAVNCDDKSPEVTRTAKLPEVNALTVQQGLTVEYVPGVEQSISVSAPEGILPYISTEMEGTTLVCKVTKSVNYCMDAVHIKVKSPGISVFSVSSGAMVDVVDSLLLGSKPLTITASSGASIDMKYVVAGSGAITASSGASVDIAGAADKVILEASSGASIDAVTLKANTGSAMTSAGGSVECSIAKPTAIKESSGGSIVNKY